MYYQKQEEMKGQPSGINPVPLQTNSSAPECSSSFNQTFPNPYFYSTNYIENSVSAFSVPPPPIHYLPSHHYVPPPPYPPPDFPAINQFSSAAQAIIPQHYSSHSYPYLNESQEKSDFSDAKIGVEKKKVMDDEMWVLHWLGKVKTCETRTSFHNNIKIHEIKENLSKIIFLLKGLNEIKGKMENSFRDMEEREWKSLSCNFEESKRNILNIVSKMPSKEEIKTVVSKRFKKRLSRARQKSKRKTDSVLAHERRQQLHHQIDTWMKDMRAAIDNKKREESLKKEADCVLSEVLRKKADGRKQLGLMTALLKLRQLRAKSAANRGQNISVDSGIKFSKVAENLKNLWEKQLKEYDVEENGMRVMLSEAVDERDQSRVLRERQLISEWNKLLFGSNKPNIPDFFLSASENIESFVKIRQSWDKFITYNKTSVESNIPIGWVVPCNPSSSKWAELLE